MASDLAIATTAWRRPYYLQQSLASWRQVRGVAGVPLFAVQLGSSERQAAQCRVIRDSGLDLRVFSDSVPGGGAHRAIPEAADRAFEVAGFAVLSEEDVLVSDDVLEYFTWAAREFAGRDDVLGVCAHSVGGQGWDEHVPAQDGDADQQAVRLRPYFNAWCWGTWRDRWEKVLRPEWDWDCTSGSLGFDSGYDWNIHARVTPRRGMSWVVPDASRSQNIGRLEGLYSNEYSFSFAQSASFRERRSPCHYRLEGTP